MIIDNIGGEWEIIAKVFYDFLVETETSKHYGNSVITDISINNYIHIIDACHKMFKSLKHFYTNT